MLTKGRLGCVTPSESMNRLAAALHKLAFLGVAFLLVGDAYWCRLASGCEFACSQCERSCRDCSACPNGCRCDEQSADSCFCKGASVSSSENGRSLSGRASLVAAPAELVRWNGLTDAAATLTVEHRLSATGTDGRVLRLLMQSLLN